MPFHISHYAISSCVAAALLAGCGGSQPPIGVPGAMPQTPLTTHGKTFSYTGAKQTFVVPRGVTHITVVARGAGGESCPRTGRGARVYAVIPVASKERLDIYVGGSGGSPGGGFNGGGSSYGLGYGGGGGASDVRVRPGRLRDRILVAAGGGGGGGHLLRRVHLLAAGGWNGRGRWRTHR